MPDDDKTVTAYQIYERVTLQLHPAPLERLWMSGADQRFPYRCLPLNIANQNGWIITCPTDFRAYWYGGAVPKDVEIRFDGPADPCVSSHFGLGVVTFSIPYLFRTPEGINLWVKGPSNSIKDGVQALEGVVESDWSFSTFTMNWKITRPNEWVQFHQNEPICMVVPIPRGFTETFNPELALLESNPELHAKYTAWELSRRGFLDGLRTNDPDVVKRGWQKDYFQGKLPEGHTFAGHQTRLNVKPFTRGDKPA